MTKTIADKSKAIPTRTDMREEDKWDVTVLYKSDEDWENDFKKAGELIKQAASYSGKLNTSPKLLYECLESRSGLSLIGNNLYQYAKLNQDLDNRVSKYQAMTERAAMLGAQADAAFSFVEPELLKIEDDKLTEMAAQFPKTDVYDFYVEELIRSREHIRSTEVEEILAQAQMIARGPDSIFSKLDDADIKYASIKDEKGNDVQLTKQRFARFMESPDQRVRRDAYCTFNKVYEEHINTLGASLSATLNKDVFYAGARRYESCLHMALDAGNIPVSVYNSLIESTESDLSALHKWMEICRKMLRIEKIYPYDVYCPLFPEQNFEVPYDEAVKEVLSAMAPLGEKYCKTLENAFASRWVDVYETEGKTSGAYNWGNYQNHPFVLMNYNNSVDNMFTLAHELGHALHSFMSCRKQPYPKHQYTIFVAEVASTLNEGLLLQYLLKKSPDRKMKLFLLNRHILNTLGTFFHQILYAHFELMVHEKVEKGDAISPDLANELWEELTAKYYGPAVTMDEYTKYKWARIPHFYNMYYVYQYATSYAASQAILDKFNAGEAGIIDKYLDLLSSGGSDYPINQLKKCGVDMTTPEPVKATLKLFAEQVDEVERLTSED